MPTMTQTFSPPNGRMVEPATFVSDGVRAALRVTRCRDCGAAWFPARTQCATCASLNVDATVTGDTGTVYASTTVQIGPPQFEPPYVLAYVDVDDVRVLAQVIAANPPPPGTAVELGLTQIGSDEEGPMWSYVAVPVALEGEEA